MNTTTATTVAPMQVCVDMPRVHGVPLIGDFVINADGQLGRIAEAAEHEVICHDSQAILVIDQSVMLTGNPAFREAFPLLDTGRSYSTQVMYTQGETTQAVVSTSSFKLWASSDFMTIAYTWLHTLVGKLMDDGVQNSNPDLLKAMAYSASGLKACIDPATMAAVIVEQLADTPKEE